MKHLDSSGGTWRYLKPFGSIWNHLTASGGIWSHLEASGGIWTHLEASGLICSHLDSSRIIWRNRESSVGWWFPSVLLSPIPSFLRPNFQISCRKFWIWRTRYNFLVHPCSQNSAKNFGSPGTNKTKMGNAFLRTIHRLCIRFHACGPLQHVHKNTVCFIRP